MILKNDQVTRTASESAIPSLYFNPTPPSRLFKFPRFIHCLPSFSSTRTPAHNLTETTPVTDLLRSLNRWTQGEFFNGTKTRHSDHEFVATFRVGVTRGELRGLLGKDISLLITEGVLRRPLQSASSLGCNYCLNGQLYILGQLRIAFQDSLECRSSARELALRHNLKGRLKAWVNCASATTRASSRSRLSLNKIIIGIISTVKCYFRLYSPKNWEFRTICQLTTYDDRRPCISLCLPKYTITHSVKIQQAVESVCVIVEPVAKRRILGPPEKSDCGPKAGSYDKYILGVSQALGFLESCPPRCGGVRYATGYRSLSWHYFFQDGDLFNSCQVIYSQFGLAIHQNDHQARRRFVEWAQNEIAVLPDFHKRILFSDEAHFWLNGYVNKQNCRIWSEANPQVYVETPLHPEKLTGALYGLVESFFKNDEGHNVTVNGDRYRAMITNFFIPELNNHDVQELWFQQDGATCPTARATIDLLKDTFGDRLISRFGPVNWPPRSCDLTPLDYFLWGYVKSLVYADKPQTLDHLEDNIRRVIADIRPQMLEKVIENWTSRLDYIRASRGSPMPEIIFKM
ncbi:uncharacterized protein TNCV_2130831 [Trichonephila clavipes]|nr:uncharacterized protein TNCV_2130831 [Trichonephila clavipes]